MLNRSRLLALNMHGLEAAYVVEGVRPRRHPMHWNLPGLGAGFSSPRLYKPRADGKPARSGRPSLSGWSLRLPLYL
jgi:hypothetical protein